MTQARRRAVLFDATGTLIELRETVGAVYARVAAEQGALISAWRLDDAFARVWRGSPALVFPGLTPDGAALREREAWREIVRQTFLAADSGARPADAEACFETLYAHFARGAAWRVRDGAREALAELRSAGFRLGIVSNFDHRLHAILAELGLRATVDLVLLPSDTGLAKPDPAIFRAALAALEVPAANACFVGDDAERDLAGARAAGLRAIDAGALATLTALPALLRGADQEDVSR